MTPKIRKLYRYRVRSAEVTDGDTYHLTVDLGFYLTAKVPIRLDGFDTPEKNAKDPTERARAAEASQVAWQWLEAALTDPASTVWVETDFDPQGGFGRWLGNVWSDQAGVEIKLGHHLAEKDLATFWPQRWRQKYLDASES